MINSDCLFLIIIYFALTLTINSVGNIFAELCNIVSFSFLKQDFYPCCFEFYNCFFSNLKTKETVKNI
jgi:hypothetical protein